MSDWPIYPRLDGREPNPLDRSADRDGHTSPRADPGLQLDSELVSPPSVHWAQHPSDYLQYRGCLFPLLGRRHCGSHSSESDFICLERTVPRRFTEYLSFAL